MVHTVPSMSSFAISTVLLVTLFVGGTTKEPITCAAGHFELGENASLTCHFHQDMNGSKHHVYVMHYPFGTPKNFSGYDVVKCSDLSDDEPQCRVAEGYQFNKEITDRLTVRIPNVTELFAGTYVCQLVPPDDTQMIMCNLTVGEQVVTETSQAWAPDFSYTTLPQQSGSNKATIIAVSATLSAVIVILFAIITYLINRIRNHERKKEGTAPTDEKTPMCSFDSGLSQSGDDSTTPKASNDVDDQHCDSAYNSLSWATTTPRISIIPPQEAEQTLVKVDVHQCGPGTSKTFKRMARKIVNLIFHGHYLRLPGSIANLIASKLQGRTRVHKQAWLGSKNMEYRLTGVSDKGTSTLSEIG